MSPIQIPVPLPPGVTEQDGRYVAPYEREGPAVFTDDRGRQVLVFMYAHFVFCWPEQASTVDILHGHVPGRIPARGSNITIFRGIVIDPPWCGDRLITFAQKWVRDRLNLFCHNK